MAPCIANNPNKAWDDWVHYLIILMDEMFNAEHLASEKCGTGIWNLVLDSGVVIEATHRRGHFWGVASRAITLSGGKVIVDERIMLPVNAIDLLTYEIPVHEHM